MNFYKSNLIRYIIIVVQNKNITPDYKRKPGANTLSYFPLRQNFTDVKGARTINAYNVSISGGYANLTQTTSRMPFSPAVGGTSITAMCRYYYQRNTSGSWNSIFVRDGGDYHHLLISGNNNDGVQIGRVGYYYANGGKFNYGSYNLTDNNRYHLVITKNGANEKIYVNAQLILEKTNSFDNNSFPISIIGNYSSSNGQQGALGKMCEVIFETGNWSQADITKYFNKTKSEFGY